MDKLLTFAEYFRPQNGGCFNPWCKSLVRFLTDLIGIR
jgi:hypothetical protein